MQVSMKSKMPFFMIAVLVFLVSIACSLSSLQQRASSAKQTANAVKSEVGGIISVGDSIIKTAQAIETKHPGVLETVKAVGTKAAPILNALESAATDHPDLISTAQAAIQQDIPTGEPPDDIPLLEHQQMKEFFGTSQYIFYTSPSAYSYVLDFYKGSMPGYGWQYLEDESHEYPNAAQLCFVKDDRRATVNLSLNTMNNTTSIIINFTDQ
jgi:hypothetical protein